MPVRITSIVGDSYHFETAKKMLLDQISMPSAPTEMTIPIQLLKNTEFFRQLGLACFHKATVSDLTSERELPFYKAIRHEIEHPIGESREIKARDREITRLQEELAAATSTPKPHPTTDSRFF